MDVAGYFRHDEQELHDVVVKWPAEVRDLALNIIDWRNRFEYHLADADAVSAGMDVLGVPVTRPFASRIRERLHRELMVVFLEELKGLLDALRAKPDPAQAQVVNQSLSALLEARGTADSEIYHMFDGW